MKANSLSAIGEALFIIEQKAGECGSQASNDIRAAAFQIRDVITRMNKPAVGQGTREQIIADILEFDYELECVDTLDRLKYLDPFSLSVARELVAFMVVKFTAIDTTFPHRLADEKIKLWRIVFAKALDHMMRAVVENAGDVGATNIAIVGILSGLGLVVEDYIKRQAHELETDKFEEMFGDRQRFL